MFPTPTEASAHTSQAFTCTICFELVDPKTLEELLCCHRLCCSSCLTAHVEARSGGPKTQPPACPCCRETPLPGQRPLPDNPLYLRLANEIPVQCPGPGCTWKGGLRDYWQEHLERCGAVAAPCRHGCGEVVAGRDGKRHDAVCANNTETCSLCGEEVHREALEEHEASAWRAHVRILREQRAAASSSADAAAQLGAVVSELQHLRAAVEALQATTASLSDVAYAHFTGGCSCTWILAAPAAFEDWEEEGRVHETQPWCTAAGVHLWLRAVAAEDRGKVEVHLVSDGPVLLKDAVVLLAPAPGAVGWSNGRSGLYAEDDLALVDEDETPQDEEDAGPAPVLFLTREPVAVWTAPDGSAASPLPRCSLTLRARAARARSPATRSPRSP